MVVVWCFLGFGCVHDYEHWVLKLEYGYIRASMARAIRGVVGVCGVGVGAKLPVV